MTKLYELTGQYLALSRMADDPDMPENALADTLEGLEGDIQIKAMGLLQVVSGLEGDTTAIDAEIKRLQDRKKVIQNRADSLRAYLHDNMERSGIDKISCPLFSITLAKARQMVVVTDESLIPEQFIKTTITKAPVKADILKALQSGAYVSGCALGESKRALLVK